MNIQKVIEKYALENAVKFKGKASAGNVLGKVIGEYPDWRKKAEELKKKTEEIVAKINMMDLEEQKNLLQKTAPKLLEEKKYEKREPLRTLQNTGKNIVMRFEPSPSGALHLGHSYTLLLNSEYCRKYKGKLIVRISDTNPDNIDPLAYKLIEEDANWITGGNVAQFVVQSDRMESYYKYALKLIEEHHAYICTCPAEEFKKLISKKAPCSCREKGVNENLEGWKKMFSEFTDGEAVVRLKTDINHKNPALRETVIMRINSNEHPRQKNKYQVWPMMNFAVAVDDHDLGLTHVLRGKDHYDNTRRQLYIYNYLKWKPPEFLHHGRINFEGLRLSASETRRAIEEHRYEGWDDIRLPFLPALKRRGFQPNAFTKFILSIGLTMADKKVSAGEFFKSLNFYNKEILDPAAKRYFFIPNPKKIKITNAPKQDLELNLHPETIRGGRKFKTTDRFYVSEKDHKEFKNNKMYRLMDCLNFKKVKNKFVFDSLEYPVWKEKGDKIVHWLPADKTIAKVKLFMPDGSVQEGFGEEAMKKIKAGDIVQLERIAFARLDSKEDNCLNFWFTH